MQIQSVIAYAFVLILGASLLQSPQAQASTGEVEPDRSASFRIEFEDLSSRVAHVEGEITVLGGTIRMVSWGHPWLPNGWSTFIENFEVRDLEGTLVEAEPVTEEGWGTWTVDVEDETRLSLSYDIRFTHDTYDWSSAGGQDSRPSYSNGGLYLVSRALFIYSPYGVETATVELVTPEGWAISTPWEQSASDPNTYIVDGWASLVNNALVVGNHIQRTIQIDGMSVTLAIDPGLAPYADDFETTFRTQLDAYGAMFGGTPNINYLVALREADEIEGEAFNNSFNQIFLAEHLEERRHIWAAVLGHELFHLWNGGGYALVGAEKSRVEWFTEGFTEYYAGLVSFRTDILDEDQYFNKMARYFARYHIAKRMWPAEAISLVEAGEDKQANWLYLYGGGATIALILDIEIRERTGGEQGLNDAMHLLNERFGETQTPFDVSDVLGAVNEVSNSDFGPLFEQYVEGSEDMPDIAHYLQKAGLIVDQYGDEFYVRRNPNATAAQTAIYTAIFEQEW